MLVRLIKRANVRLITNFAQVSRLFVEAIGFCISQADGIRRAFVHLTLILPGNAGRVSINSMDSEKWSCKTAIR